MTLHPRERIVREAENAFCTGLLNMVLTNDASIEDECAVLVWLFHYIKENEEGPSALPSLVDKNSKLPEQAVLLWVYTSINLTMGERVCILARCLSTVSKYQVRHERHGDTDKPGGLE